MIRNLFMNIIMYFRCRAAAKRSKADNRFTLEELEKFHQLVQSKKP